MAPRTFEASFGPPFTGTNTYVDPRALQRDQLATSEWVDLSRGVVKALYGPGTSIATLSAHTRFAVYVDAAKGFISDGLKFSDGTMNWACRDAPDLLGNQVVYHTKIQTDGTILPASVNYSTNEVTLGIAAPTNGGVTNGTSGSARNYAYTFYDALRGYESNPYPALPLTTLAVTQAVGAKVTGLPLGAPGSSATHIKVYATNPGSSDATKYYIGAMTLGSATFFTDTTGAQGDQTQRLSWSPGGTPKITALPADHSPAPILTCLSDGPHAVRTADFASTGTGIVFGAVNNVVRWSMVGYPYYWPSVNAAQLPYTVIAMVTRGAITYALTEGGIWAFTGTSDASIQSQRLQSSQGILRYAGKTVAQTPYGIVYLSREGPTLLDGTQARPLCAELVDPMAWNPFELLFAGAYQDGLYFLQAGPDVCYVIDLRGYPAVKVMNADLTAGAFVTIPYVPGGPTPGVYLIGDNTGVVLPWSPLLGTLVPGASPLPWAFVTARSDIGEPAKLKRARQLRASVSGPVTAQVVAYKGGTYNTSVLLSLVPGQQTYRLQAGLEGTHLELIVTDPVGTSELYNLTLVGEVFDGD